MNAPERERRDWTLIIFIIPIGILLILIVGQLAVRIVPHWSVNAGMQSNMDPDTDSINPIAFLPPLLPQVLTPMAWAENFLTPMGEVSFPSFMVIEPTSTPAPKTVEPTSTETVTPTITASVTPSMTPSATSTVVFTGTPPTETPNITDTPVSTDTPTDTPTATPTDTPTATPTDTPTATPTDTPTATPSLCEDTTASNVGSPLPCIYAPAATFVDPAPTEIGVGTLPDNTGPGGGGLGYILDGTYIVIKLSITVSSVPDGNYDLVYYEYNFNNTGNIHLDNIIIGISNVPDGSQYYEVFNWGDWNGTTGNVDTNSNVGDVAQAAGSEVDNANVPTSDLYDPDGSAGAAPQTGILIDVDTAPNGPPPPATYDYVVIISPSNPAGDPAGIDAIATVEEPIPTPTP